MYAISQMKPIYVKGEWYLIYFNYEEKEDF